MRFLPQFEYRSAIPEPVQSDDAQTPNLLKPTIFQKEEVGGGSGGFCPSSRILSRKTKVSWNSCQYHPILRIPSPTTRIPECMSHLNCSNRDGSRGHEVEKCGGCERHVEPTCIHTHWLEIFRSMVPNGPDLWKCFLHGDGDAWVMSGGRIAHEQEEKKWNWRKS